MTVTKERAKANEIVRPRRREFPGTPAQVHHVRDFVSRSLAGRKVSEEATLLASELATNAILHTESGYGIGTFTVIVYLRKSAVRIEVEDAGSAMTPSVLPRGDNEIFGRGLSIVDVIASHWGHYTTDHGRVVWFELEW